MKSWKPDLKRWVSSRSSFESIDSKVPSSVVGDTIGIPTFVRGGKSLEAFPPATIKVGPDLVGIQDQTCLDTECGRVSISLDISAHKLANEVDVPISYPG